MCQNMLFSVSVDLWNGAGIDFTVGNEERGQNTYNRTYSDFFDTWNPFKNEVMCQNMIFSMSVDLWDDGGKDLMVRNEKRGPNT